MKGLINVPLTNIYCDQKTEVVTQAIFATEVEIIKEKEGWYKIRIPIQQDYEGWLEKEKVFIGSPPENPLGRLIVHKHLTELKDAPAGKAFKIMDLVLNTRLWAVARQGGWYAVQLPGGWTAWVEAAAVSWEKPRAAGEEATGEQILDLARSFLGVPYLWGGLSPAGFDCSGLVYTVYALSGYYLHRDCNLQLQYDGIPVDLTKIRPGDLLYFYEDAAEKPTHVGIYEANQLFINASSKQNSVTRYSLQENNWSHKISGIKRILGTA
jgi:hypothetical protein